MLASLASKLASTFPTGNTDADGEAAAVLELVGEEVAAAVAVAVAGKSPAGVGAAEVLGEAAAVTVAASVPGCSRLSHPVCTMAGVELLVGSICATTAGSAARAVSAQQSKAQSKRAIVTQSNLKH